jgi:alkylated DNA repair dioxygenase AlkB
MEMELIDMLRTNNSYLKIGYLDEREICLLESAIEEIQGQLLVNPEIIVFGKKVYQHRSVGFFSNVTTGYLYSGRIALAHSLTPSLMRLLQNINQFFQSNYNGILINYYSNGSDYIGAHSDDESSLGPVGVISLSYGATRKFRIREKSSKQMVMDFPATSGVLIWMGGDFQKEFTHEVPVEKKIREGRYAFTFRQHIVHEENS